MDTDESDDDEKLEMVEKGGKMKLSTTLWFYFPTITKDNSPIEYSS